MPGEHLLIYFLGLVYVLGFVSLALLYIVVRRKMISNADHDRCQCPPEVHRESRAADKRPAEPFLPR